MKLETRRQFWGVFFAAPNLILFFLLVFLPVLGALILAFKDFRLGQGILGSPWVGLENFKDLMFNPIFATDFWVGLWNTFLITFALVPVNIAIALGIAAMIFPLGTKAQGFYKSAFYLPGIISGVIIAIVWQWMFAEHNGLINITFNALGMHGVSWFSERWAAIATIIISSIPYAPGAGIILYIAALGRIPQELLEAASIDGANLIQRWRYIIWPLLKPTTLYLVVMSTIEAFKIFTPVYVMTRARPANQSTSIVYEIYQNAFVANEFGIASAEALVLFGLVMIFAVIQFKWLRSDEQY